MMKKVTRVSVVIAVVFAVCAASAVALPQLSENTHVLYDFETAWTGNDFAPGWADTSAENGQDPRSVMMEFGYFGYQGGSSMRVIAVDTPSTGAFTADVSPIGYEEAAMAKEYDPWVKVMYYDDGYDSEASYNSSLHRAGQMFAVPDSPAGPSDWTDVQFGAGLADGDFYYHANANGSADVASTGIARVDGWQEFIMQLSSVDGKIHFYIDGANAGTTSRDDYLNLVGFGLSTVFSPALQDWPHNNPSTVWDNYEFGSSYVPEPMTLSLLGLGSLVVLRRKRS